MECFILFLLKNPASHTSQEIILPLHPQIIKEFGKHWDDVKVFCLVGFIKKKSVIENLSAKDKKVQNDKNFNPAELFHLYVLDPVFRDLKAKQSRLIINRARQKTTILFPLGNQK